MLMYPSLIRRDRMRKSRRAVKERREVPEDEEFNSSFQTNHRDHEAKLEKFTSWRGASNQCFAKSHRKERKDRGQCFHSCAEVRRLRRERRKTQLDLHHYETEIEFLKAKLSQSRLSQVSGLSSGFFEGRGDGGPFPLVSNSSSETNETQVNELEQVRCENDHLHGQLSLLKTRLLLIASMCFDINGMLSLFARDLHGLESLQGESGQLGAELSSFLNIMEAQLILLEQQATSSSQMLQTAQTNVVVSMQRLMLRLQQESRRTRERMTVKFAQKRVEMIAKALTFLHLRIQRSLTRTACQAWDELVLVLKLSRRLLTSRVLRRWRQLAEEEAAARKEKNHEEAILLAQEALMQCENYMHALNVAEERLGKLRVAAGEPRVQRQQEGGELIMRLKEDIGRQIDLVTAGDERGGRSRSRRMYSRLD